MSNEQRITWTTDCNAPCIGRIVAADGSDRLIQTDWDHPGVASTFGWSTRTVQKCGHTETDEVTGDQRGFSVGDCQHNGTDGTVDCPECGVKTGDFIASAGEWLLDNDGAEADDPGYFAE